MKLSALFLTSTIALTTTPIFAAITTGTVIGTTEPVIRATLETNGYMVQSIEVEDDEIEVETLLDGVEMAFELSAVTGAVLEIEIDNDDDDK